MANKFIIKRSSVAGRTPSAVDLEVGELAINLTDGRLFTKDGSNTVIDVVGQNVNTTANVVFKSIVSNTISASALLAAGSPGTSGQILTSDGQNIYWIDAPSGGGGFTNGQSIAVNQLQVNSSANFQSLVNLNGSLTFNTVSGTPGQIVHQGTTGPEWASIKTINGVSIIGDGNIVIDVGSSSSVNLDAQYTWSNAHTFDATVTANNLIIANTATVGRISANGSTGSLGQVLTTDGGNVYWSDPAAGGASLKVLPINQYYNNDFGDLSTGSVDAFGVSTMYSFDCATAGFLQTTDLNRNVAYSDDQLNVQGL